MAQRYISGGHFGGRVATVRDGSDTPREISYRDNQQNQADFWWETKIGIASYRCFTEKIIE